LLSGYILFKILTMQEFNPEILKQLYQPEADSHKGQNGKLLIIAGSALFHAPLIWSAQIASRLVDMVYIASTPENNEIVKSLKTKFQNGIVIPRSDINSYINEADCILIGPGLPRKEGEQSGDDDTKKLTESILSTKSQLVLDGGALQTIDKSQISVGAILTPHVREFEMLFGNNKKVQDMAKQHSCIILLKGQVDIVCSPDKCVTISGGNPGMTKGGTGDVLAGLVAALACKNDPFLATTAGSYLNKKAGELLAETVGNNFNATDLLNQIPQTISFKTGF